MENLLEKEIVILPSHCDSAGKLGLADTFDVFMDIAAQHASMIGIGIEHLGPRGLFWLTAKTKIRFFRRPRLMERVTVATWSQQYQRVHCERSYSLTGADGELLAAGKTDWAVIEIAAGQLHELDDVFPGGLDFSRPPLIAEPFARINKDFTDAAPLGSYTVRSVDIDFGGHMNNAAYVYALLGLIPLAKLKEMRLNEIDVSFVASCFEGETLTAVQREVADGWEIGLLKADGKPALLAKLSGGGR